MRARFVAATERLLDDDPRIAVVLAEISADLFADAQARYPGRVINVGIREQLMMGVTGGLALTGLRPIAHSYAPFLVERPYEQVKLDLGHQDVGAVLVSVGASYDSTTAGRTHHSPGDVALLDTQGGWTVYVPGHPEEVDTLLRAAVVGDDRVYLRLSTRANSASRPVRPGVLDVVREGRCGVAVAVGPMLDSTLAAVEGLDVTVLYAATARPLDAAGLRAAVPGGHAAGPADVILVEPYLAGTSTHAVADALADVPHRVLALGVGREEVRAYGTVEDHDRLHGLDPAGLRERITGFLAASPYGPRRLFAKSNITGI